MDSLQVQGDHLIGENIMLLEEQVVPEKPQYYQQIVAPNYFNPLLQERSSSDNDKDDETELKYLQNHFKTKVELMPRMQIGYLFKSKEFNGPENFETCIYLVKTFSFYQWRQLSLLKRSRIIVEDLSKDQLKSLCYA